jgi:uncharacterized membrane protein YqjE
MKDEQGHTQSVPEARITASGEIDRECVTTASDSPTLLLKKAVDDMRELVRLEVSLARGEVSEQLARGKTAAIAFAATAVLAIAAFTLLVVALAFAVTPTWIGSLIAAGILLAIAATAAAIGWIKLPKDPLAQTRRRLDNDVKELKEHAA